MAELTVNDVSAYTNGRLAIGDAETLRLLNTGLAVARRYCGWHVTPSRADTITVDGPGSPLLVLPTLRLTTLTSVTENGIALTVGDLRSSARGLVRKKSGGCWTVHYGGITVAMTHGFADAPEWQSAVLSYIDRTSMAVAGGGRETIGPFTFAQTGSAATAAAFSDAEKMLLDLYRLEMAP
jgi:hypothetical protein